MQVLGAFLLLVELGFFLVLQCTQNISIYTRKWNLHLHNDLCVYLVCWHAQIFEERSEQTKSPKKCTRAYRHCTCCLLCVFWILTVPVLLEVDCTFERLIFNAFINVCLKWINELSETTQSCTQLHAHFIRICMEITRKYDFKREFVKNASKCLVWCK